MPQVFWLIQNWRQVLEWFRSCLSLGVLGQQVQGEEHMKYEDIKFFSERCEKHPDHQSGMITNSMIQQRLHEEIDELREYIEETLKDKNTLLKNNRRK